MLDDARDFQVEALLEVCIGATNAALATALNGTKAIRIGFGIPLTEQVILQKIPGLEPPFLSIYRIDDHIVQRTMSKRENESTFNIDYVPGPAGRDETESRGALLRRAWLACSSAILDDNTPAVQGGAKVLTLAGFTYVDPSTFHCRYPDNAYPGNDVLQWFRGTFTATHKEPGCKPHEILPFLSVDIKYHIPGATDPAVDPIVEQIEFPPAS